jgi:hypothetical protein
MLLLLWLWLQQQLLLACLKVLLHCILRHGKPAAAAAAAVATPHASVCAEQ